MSFSTIGDAAQFFMLRRDGSELRSELSRLTSELSTGVAADIGAATSGRFSALSDITRGLALNRSYADGIALGAMQAEARQLSLDRISAEIDGFAPELQAFASGGSLADLTLVNANAPERFDSVVATLNTRAAGAALFGADASNVSPLIDAEAMLTALRPLVAAAATPADFEAAVETWFMAPGGGFETTAWQGGAGSPPPLILAEGESVDAAVTAFDLRLRGVLSGLAMAALASEGLGPAGASERREIITAAAERIRSAEGGIITVRAELGTHQARIDEARVRTEANRAALEAEDSRIRSVDPYRAAIDLQALETRLESHYLLTAKLSRMSLTDYLR